ncbi:MAG: hypothetical protein JWO78_265 [Micavibrio sp.]|nr:hypothetical protein [Micavibrio sp.]
MTKKKRGMSIQVRAILIFSLICGLIFMPTMVLVIIGMLPTLTAVFIDRSSEKTRGVTVGALNLAGCMPFLLQLWGGGNTLDHAFTIITDPRTIIVMYCAASVGYIVDWAVSGLVATIMVQTSGTRLQNMAKRRTDLIARWGREVTGDLPLDSQGFPLDQDAEGGNAGKAARAR